MPYVTVAPVRYVAMAPKRDTDKDSEYSYVTDEEYATAKASPAPKMVAAKSRPGAATTSGAAARTRASSSSSDRAPRHRRRSPRGDDRRSLGSPTGRGPAATPVPEPPAGEPATCRPAATAADPVVRSEGREDEGPRDYQPKGKGRRRRASCPICWQNVSRYPASLSQHQYWSEECMAWSFYNQGVPWRTARRRVLDLKEQREEDYYGLEEPTVPAPSLAARRRLEEEMQPSHADAPVEKEEKKEKKRRRRHRHRRPSPSPEVERRKGPKRPPSDDDHDEADRPSVTRGPGGTWILHMPAMAK